MSDGFALQIAKTFPIVEKKDMETKPLDKNKLGTFIPVEIVFEKKKFFILNCYTQFNYAGYDLEEVDLFEYEQFRKILKKIARKYPKEKIAMPLIGTGHANGDREIIIDMIKQELKNNDVDIIIYSEYNKPRELNSWLNKIKCFVY